MADKETPAVKTPAQEPAAAAEEKVAATPEKTAAPAAAATEETTAAPATGEVTPTTAEDAEAKAPATDAGGVEGYEKEEAAFFAEGEAEEARQKAEKWEQAKAAAKADEAGSEADRTAGTEETPAAAETETPAATEETPAVTATTAPATTEEELRSDKRIRLKGLPDGHLVDAANEIARAENIPFAQAWERVAPKKAAPEQAAAATTEAPALRTRDEIQAEITAKKAEKKQAATDLDTGKMYDADEAIEALREEIAKVDAAEQSAAQERQSAERTQFEQTVASSTAKATEYWPESADKESALSKRTLELADAYEKDPAMAHLVSKPDSPFYFTQLAAQELGLLPKHLRKPAAAAPAAAITTPKPATPTATKPAPKNQRAVVGPTQSAASPASGAARTTHEGSGIDSALEKIHGVASYEKLEEEFLTGQLA